MDKQTMKKLVMLSSAAIISSIIGTAVYAEDATGTGTTTGGSDSAVLQQIQTNTANALLKVNDLPTYLANIGQFIVAWMKEDDSDTTATIQATFSQMGTLLNADATTQASLQQQLNTDLLAGTTKTNLPSANDLVYSSILGTPFYTPDPRGASVVPQYNYIKNASGMTLYHVFPNGAWRGNADEVRKYTNYYNTMMAVESFGGYVLSNQYADGNQFNTLQTTLITQASDPQSWFAQVASENIGWVLRQILMYQSQSFVLMTQLVQTQKQMVTAQVMTNAAIIAASGANESQMIRNAQGI